MIPSFNLQATVKFFTEILGFFAVMDTPEYGVVMKDNLTIHLLRAGENIGEMECYLEVDDIDGLWAEIQQKLQGIRVKAPFNREYGMREFHIAIPHTHTLLFVGQTIKL